MELTNKEKYYRDVKEYEDALAELKAKKKAKNKAKRNARRKNRG